MEKIPLHNKTYEVTFVVDSQDNLTVLEAAPEIMAILESNSLQELCENHLPTMWGRYKAELKFWFFDDPCSQPYCVKYGFDVLKITRLLPR